MNEITEPVEKASGFKAMFIPCATVFISSFCIMVIELVAGRILARYLGSSLYTWTSVIGVVLAGITIGNYIGGRLADSFAPKKTLAVLFAVSAVACVATIILNNLIGQWTWLWQFSWPMRTFLHVSFVFLLPSTLLGTISPVVAKMALERGLPTGRTVGDIYAWGAAGSIAGTFVAGYYLIAVMGTISIIWLVGGVMMLMALLYAVKSWFSRGCAFFFLLALVMGISPWGPITKAGQAIELRQPEDPDIIYEDETQYCYVAIKTTEKKPEKRVFIQDQLIHSAITLGDLSSLEYSYEQIMSAVTHRFGRDKQSASFLILGGGGYVLPRYLEKYWSGSTVDVVEIDPGITEAAHSAFELDRNTSIKTILLDARNYVDQLIEQQRSGEKIAKYDFIYEDALDHYAIPYQLTTLEFDQKISQILNNDGIYMVELIDIFDSSLFLGAFVNTMKQVFPFVSVITENDIGSDSRNTFIVIGAKKKRDLQNVCKGYCKNEKIWYMSDSDIAVLEEKSKGRVLTDNYAPVEHLLAPVVKANAEIAALNRKQVQARKLAEEAEKLAWSGNLRKTLAKLEELVAADPAVSVRAYQTMAFILTERGKTTEAMEMYRTTIHKYDSSRFKNEMPDVHYNFGMFLNNLGISDEAKEQFSIALQGYRDIIAQNPKLARPYVQLGNIAAENGDFTEAVKNFQQAVELKPDDLDNRFNLIAALEMQGQQDMAIEAVKDAIEYMQNNNLEENTAKLREYLQKLESAGKNPDANEAKKGPKLDFHF